MHWVKVTNAYYEQSRRYLGQVGEVVGHWGPDSNQDGREGLLVDFGEGEVVGLTHNEVEEVPQPPAAEGRNPVPENASPGGSESET